MPILLGQLLLVAIIGYLWGSVPAGYWMGKLLRGKDFDIRAYGRHKIGATNVLRTLGMGPAAIGFFFVGLANPAFFGKVPFQYLLFLVLGPLLVIILHYDNIGRLLAGTERKIGQKVQVEEQPKPGTPSNSSSNVQA